MIEALATVSLLFFAATLRKTTKRWNEDSILPSVAFAGGIFAAGEVAGDVDPAVLQTFNAAWANFFFPLVIGLASLILATSLAGWQSRALPKWLAVIGVVIFVAFFTPAGFIVFLVGGIWIIVLSVLLWRRESNSAEVVTSSANA